MSNQEQNIQNALNDLQLKRFRSIRQSALYNHVSPTTLAYRVGGRKSKTQTERKSQRFTNQEEKSIVQWLSDLQRQHISANYIHIREMLQNLLQKKGDLKPLGEHFITRFVRRHPQLKSGYSRTLDAVQLSALDPSLVEAFFSEFNTLKTEYNIDLEDIYNMDETGFQMGQNQADYVVYNSTQGRPVEAGSENTNWVTIIECIGVQSSIKPYMIFKGKRPETNWLPDTESLPDYVYAYSEKGWTDNELTVDWLQCVFLPETSEEQKHRILILDNQKSHISGEFQLLCLENNIHLLFLPAHSSHKLQPLDMGPFSPLAREYSQALKKYTPTGLAVINRRVFVEIYAQIQPNSLSVRAIRAGWKRTGLYPLNKQRILDDSEVKSYGCTTPEYQPASIPEGLNGLLATPKKVDEIQTLISKIQAASTPTTRRAVDKLGHATIQEHTGAQLLQGELQQLRQLSFTVQHNRRSKRLEKDKNQRSWNLEQVRAAREGRNRLKVPRIVKKTKKKLILALPSKNLDQEVEIASI